MKIPYSVTWHKGTQRYYKLILQKDMFGAISLVCAWGGLSSRLGNYKVITFDNYEQVAAFISYMDGLRTRRGYTLVNKID